VLGTSKEDSVSPLPDDDSIVLRLAVLPYRDPLLPLGLELQVFCVIIWRMMVISTASPGNDVGGRRKTTGDGGWWMVATGKRSCYLVILNSVLLVVAKGQFRNQCV